MIRVQVTRTRKLRRQAPADPASTPVQADVTALLASVDATLARVAEAVCQPSAN